MLLLGRASSLGAANYTYPSNYQAYLVAVLTELLFTENLCEEETVRTGKDCD